MVTMEVQNLFLFFSCLILEKDIHSQTKVIQNSFVLVMQISATKDMFRTFLI